MNIGDISKKIGLLWKELPDSEKAQYTALYTSAREEYDRQVKQVRDCRKDQYMHKRYECSNSAFYCYINEQRPLLMKEMNYHEATQVLGYRWRHEMQD